jgi:dihydroxy-acid dehydratase
LSVGHISPEAAEGGNIGLIEEGDLIHINIHERTINVKLSAEQLAERRRQMEARGAAAWSPGPRPRLVSKALEAYSLMVTSAARGAVRDLSQLKQARTNGHNGTG